MLAQEIGCALVSSAFSLIPTVLAFTIPQCVAEIEKQAANPAFYKSFWHR